jgi:hypothetical protein
VIKEATAKERALTGSRTVMTGAAAANPLKRKREVEPGAEQTTGKEYVFAKFLTSPDLLDLEVCSPLLILARSRFDVGPDRGHSLPKTVLVSAARTTPPPADIHEGGEDLVGLSA